MVRVDRRTVSFVSGTAVLFAVSKRAARCRDLHSARFIWELSLGIYCDVWGSRGTHRFSRLSRADTCLWSWDRGSPRGTNRLRDVVADQICR